MNKSTSEREEYDEAIDEIHIFIEIAVRVAHWVCESVDSIPIMIEKYRLENVSQLQSNFVSYRTSEFCLRGHAHIVAFCTSFKLELYQLVWTFVHHRHHEAFNYPPPPIASNPNWLGISRTHHIFTLFLCVVHGAVSCVLVSNEKCHVHTVTLPQVQQRSAHNKNTYTFVACICHERGCAVEDFCAHAHQSQSKTFIFSIYIYVRWEAWDAWMEIHLNGRNTVWQPMAQNSE